MEIKTVKVKKYLAFALATLLIGTSNPVWAQDFDSLEDEFIAAQLSSENNSEEDNGTTLLRAGGCTITLYTNPGTCPACQILDQSGALEPLFNACATNPQNYTCGTSTDYGPNNNGSIPHLRVECQCTTPRGVQQTTTIDAGFSALCPVVNGTTQCSADPVVNSIRSFASSCQSGRSQTTQEPVERKRTRRTRR